MIAALLLWIKASAKSVNVNVEQESLNTVEWSHGTLQKKRQMQREMYRTDIKKCCLGFEITNIPQSRLGEEDSLWESQKTALIRNTGKEDNDWQNTDDTPLTCRSCAAELINARPDDGLQITRSWPQDLLQPCEADSQQNRTSQEDVLLNATVSDGY